jgi:asparagine synthase (glutamine-hydrolysing)
MQPRASCDTTIFPPRTRSTREYTNSSPAQCSRCRGKTNLVSRAIGTREIALSGIREPIQGSDADLTNALKLRLKDAVKRRLIADVPLAAFLSGGVDSSTVVGLMQDAHPGAVKTTIGFDISTKHRMRRRLRAILAPSTPNSRLQRNKPSMSFPSCRNGSTNRLPIPRKFQLTLVSAMTRHYVTVALSGDGGDELFVIS